MIIWLRRILAVFLVVVLVLLSIPMLVVSRVNSTVGNPDFYVDQLRRADVYNFVYTDVLPQALGNVEFSGGVNLSPLRPQLLTIARQTAPPDWLQAQVEQAIRAVVPYVTGDAATFRVGIPLKGRVQSASTALKRALRQPGVFSPIYDQMLDSLTAQAAPGLPLGLGGTELKTIVGTVFPSDWVLTQVEQALDEVVPYLVKDKEHFSIRVNLSERMDALKPALVNILGRQQAYDSVVRDVFVRPLAQNQQFAAVGVVFSEAEITTVASQAFPLPWYQSLVPGMADSFVAYLKGTRPTLEFVIPLADRKPALADALGRLVAQKLRLPFLAGATTSLLDTILGRVVPDQVRLTEADLGMGGAQNPLSELRTVVQQGFTYTDRQLAESVGTSTTEQIRQALGSGLVFTEQDLRNQTHGEVDTVRSTMGTVRRGLVAAWLVLAVILAAIGLLGGRRWSSKLVWAAAALGITAVIALVIFGPVFSGVVQPRVSAMLTPPAAGGFESVMAAKGIAIAHNVIDSFIGGLRTQAAVLLVIALGLVVLGSIWHRRQPKPESVPPGNKVEGRDSGS